MRSVSEPVQNDLLFAAGERHEDSVQAGGVADPEDSFVQVLGLNEIQPVLADLSLAYGEI